MTYPVALDLSNYQLGITAACLQNAGLAGVILGAQIPAYSRQIAQQCKLAGVPVIGTYAFLWDVETPTVRTQKAIDLAKELGCSRVWLDCEEGNNLPGTIPLRHSQLNACIGQVTDAGLSPGIYTYEPFWRDVMGNTTLFANHPLWHANYGTNDGTKPPMTTVAYGGWTKVAIHQYRSTYPICGMQVDANYVFEEDDELSAAEKAELVELRRIVGGQIATTNGIDLLVSINNLNATLQTQDARIAALEQVPPGMPPSFMARIEVQ